MSQYKKLRNSHNQTKTEIIEEEGGPSTTTENNAALQTIEDIFKYEKPTIKDIMTILKEIFTSQQFITSKYDEILIRNLELQYLCNNLKSENIKLKEEIRDLKEDVESIQNIANEKKIEIHGLPYKNNEDLGEIVTKIGKTFDFKIEKEDIDDAYRLQTANNKDSKPKPVVVSFIRRRDKEKFLYMRKKRSLFSNEIGLEGNRVQIFLNEYLSKRKKELFWKSRKVKAEKNYKFLWTKSGKILLRKTENSPVIQVNSEEDLENLE